LLIKSFCCANNCSLPRLTLFLWIVFGVVLWHFPFIVKTGSTIPEWFLMFLSVLFFLLYNLIQLRMSVCLFVYLFTVIRFSILLVLCVHTYIFFTQCIILFCVYICWISHNVRERICHVDACVRLNYFHIFSNPLFCFFFAEH